MIVEPRSYIFRWRSRFCRRRVCLSSLKVVCNQSLGTQITMLQCTIAGGRTKGANQKSFVFVHQHGCYDVTWKPPILIMAKSYLSRDSNDVVLARKVLWKPIQHDTAKNVWCKLCVYASSRNELLRPVWKRYVYYSLTSAHSAHLTFLSWQILKARTAIQKVSKSIYRNGVTLLAMI